MRVEICRHILTLVVVAVVPVSGWPMTPSTIAPFTGIVGGQHLDQRSMHVSLAKTRSRDMNGEGTPHPPVYQQVCLVSHI